MAGECHGIRVPDERDQRGGEFAREQEEFAAPVGARGDAADAFLREEAVRACEQGEFSEQGIGEQGQEGIEFQFAVLRDGLDFAVMGERAPGRLGHHLGNHRVHLAGHEAAAGLDGRQFNLAQSALGAARQPPQVVRDLDQVGRMHPHEGAGFDEGIGVLGGVHEILGAREVEAGHGAEFLDGEEDVAARGGEAGADRGAAEVGDAQAFGAAAEAPAVAAQGAGEGAERAAEGDGDGVAQFGTAQFDDAGEGPLLLLAGLHQFRHRLLERGELTQGGDADGGGIDVVGGLVEVDVGVRVDGAAEAAGGQRGDDLVEVHVGRGAGAALEGIDDKLVRVRAGGEFVTGGGEGGADARGQIAELVIGEGAGLLHGGAGADERGMDGAAGDGEVEAGAFRLGPPQRAGGHGDFAQQVPAGPRSRGVHVTTPVPRRRGGWRDRP